MKILKVLSLIYVFFLHAQIYLENPQIKKSVNILKKKKNIDSVFSVHQIYKHFWHINKKKKRKGV